LATGRDKSSSDPWSSSGVAEWPSGPDLAANMKKSGWKTHKNLAGFGASTELARGILRVPWLEWECHSKCSWFESGPDKEADI